MNKMILTKNDIFLHSRNLILYGIMRAKINGESSYITYLDPKQFLHTIESMIKIGIIKDIEEETEDDCKYYVIIL